MEYFFVLCGFDPGGESDQGICDADAKPVLPGHAQMECVGRPRKRLELFLASWYGTGVHVRKKRERDHDIKKPYIH